MAQKERQKKLTDILVFTLLGVIMFISKLIMEILPNIHLLGILTMVYTITYRKDALKPIYIYVLLNGLYSGFSLWWFPYLYIWTILWGVAMLLPKKMPTKVAVPVYSIVCALHGLLFGTLYAPAQAIMFGLDFKMTIAWITMGLPFDIIHAVSNLFLGSLIIPLSMALKKFHKR
jgi:energy-coupling factor transport system substrate-specific component